MAEEICSVPGCDNVLSEEQRKRKMVVCSSCEAAEMHLCEVCSRKIDPDRIKDGATLCKECEMNPTDLEETETQMLNRESEEYLL